MNFWKVRNGSTAYSKKLYSRFKEAVKLIAAHPEIGQKTDDADARIKLVKPYQIIYQETSLRIEILAVWDTRRNPDDLKKIING